MLKWWKQKHCTHSWEIVYNGTTSKTLYCSKCKKVEAFCDKQAEIQLNISKIEHDMAVAKAIAEADYYDTY